MSGKRAALQAQGGERYGMLERVKRTLARNAPAAALASGTLVILLGVNAMGGYGRVRDEFYYIVCSDRLAWGYVDHPPLSVFLLRLVRTLLGDSIFAIRLLPALSAAGLVYLTGVLTRELNGGKAAQRLACLAVAVAPMYLVGSSFYSMNAFEPLLWMGAAVLLLRILKSGREELWLPFGCLMGIGLQNKLGVLVFGLALVTGMLLSGEWRRFRSKWMWLGGAASYLIAFPYVLWQMANGWPTLEFMQNARELKHAALSPMQFLSAQVLFQHPFAAPLWLTGLVALLFNKGLKKYRLFAWAYLVMLAIFIALKGKPYYASPFYPILLAAGAVAIETFGRGKRRRYVPSIYALVLLIGGLITLPLCLPVLPVQTLVQVADTAGLRPPKMHNYPSAKLPQVFADRFGWKEMVAEIARVYATLTPQEQSVAAIFTQNYGQASAVDFFGAQYGLPKAISGHNNYWLWGPRGASGEVLIIVGGSADQHKTAFDSVEQVGIHRHPLAMPFETDLPIFVCRKPKQPFPSLWPKLKFIY